MRRIVRRTVRRTGRRAVRRLRRRLVVGGFVLLAGAGAAAVYKLTHKDVERIETQTGTSVEELSEEELVTTMKAMGIKSIELDENDRTAVEK